eukprot:m.354822 g.354822  ORF g.354822 m.354822 type:complete len:468 (-) comp20726_c0_seq1:233-1636(-)
MSLDSDHINYLVYRYLQESGFQHSSFTFGQESGITRSSVAQVKIPPGSLISHLQRALNYVQVEVNLTEDGRPADLDDLDAVDSLTLIESVQPEVCEMRRQQLRSRQNDKDAPVAMDESDDCEVSPAKVTTLSGHENEVFACAWNPTFDLIASGSSDSTARIWSLDNPEDVLVLRHLAPQGEETKDVTTLDWKHDGTLLATGSYDGAGRIWTRAGELQNRLTGHRGPVFSLKWNMKGDLLVTSSVDSTVIVWETSTGQIRQQFGFHTAPCLDVDWRNNDSFASCSQDMAIFVCEVGRNDPVKKLDKGGHTDEVNAIRWDPTETYLASCSDDSTAKIWDLTSNGPVHTLKHSDKIYSLKWSPDTSSKLMLASASFDHTTKVWDAVAGVCIFTLEGHTMPVYSVDFSPSGKFLASGSFDKRILVWSMETGNLLRSHEGGGGIFEVCWDKDGKRIAGCCQDSNIVVIDFDG